MLYHGHTVSLLWQSKQSRTASARVAGASQTDSWTTARSASALPMGGRVSPVRRDRGRRGEQARDLREVDFVADEAVEGRWERRDST